jgi:hypothetical protein
MSKIAREILKLIGEYKGGNDPHGQADQEIVEQCAALAVKPDLCATDLTPIIDDCIYGSRCTDFVMRNLLMVRDVLKEGRDE